MATTNTFGIFFYLRRYKESDGTAPIYVRITVDTKRFDIAVKRRIDVANWNGEKGMAKGKSDEIKKLNTYLEQIRSRLVECYQELHLKKQVITSEVIKNKYLGIEEEEHTLMELFDFHNDQMRNILEWGTMKNYYTTKAYFQNYIQKVYHTRDLYLSQLNYKFVAGYEKLS